MLTITAPIELKCKAPVASAHEGFYHRITDNYAMITQNLTPEDLLHVMTTPPEYYFGDGDQTNIFQQTHMNRFQENHLEVVNNLINRIMVSESAELTYQDRVYITGILQKLGIKNVNEFMHQVSMVREEHQNTQQLIDLYWNHAGDLRQLVETYKNEQNTQKLTQQVSERKETLHLHEDIMNRLQTAALYQTVQNFNSRSQGDTTITNTQLQISDQSRIAQNILLQKLKNEARDEQTPLVYRHENYYEEQQLTEEQISEENVLRQINSAVMLNLIDNIYQSRSQQVRRLGDEWYHMEQAFYRNADNTMQRFENRMDARYFSSQNQQNDYRIQQNIADRREINMLSQLFENQSSEQYQVVNELLRQDFVRQELTNRISRQGDEQYISELLAEQSQYYTDRSSQIVNSLTDDRKMHQELTENRILRQTVEQQNRIRREGDRQENRVDLTQVQVHEGDVHTEGDSSVTEQQITHTDFTTVEEEISRINQENINNQSKYIQMMEGLRETIDRPREKVTAQEPFRENPAVIEHPEQAGEQPGGEEASFTEQAGALRQERKSLPPTLEQHVERRDISSVEEEISRINRENINNQSKYIQMMEGIRESMEHPRERKTAEQMRRESLMALEHPTELMEQLREEGEQQHARQEQKLKQAMQLLPEQTRQIYEIVREYLEAPEQRRRQMTGISDDVGLLVRDIKAAQTPSVQPQLVHREQQAEMEEPVQKGTEALPQQTREFRETLREYVDAASKKERQMTGEGDGTAGAGKGYKTEQPAASATSLIYRQSQPQEAGEDRQEGNTQPEHLRELREIVREYTEPARKADGKAAGDATQGTPVSRESRTEQLPDQKPPLVHREQPQETGVAPEQQAELSGMQTREIQKTLHEYMRMPSQPKGQPAGEIGEHRATGQARGQEEPMQRSAVQIVHREQPQETAAEAQQNVTLQPEQTVEIQRTVREYLDTPKQVAGQTQAPERETELHTQRVREREILDAQTELVHRQQEKVNEQTREVVERWNERSVKAPRQKNVYEDRRTEVSFVHRSQERALDEETIRQMMEQNRQVNRTVKTENETVTNFDHTERTYSNVNTQQVIQQTENVNELVRQGVQRELGVLSEKIYSKLEKRLETERRRRGI